MKCDACGAPVENGKCTYCGKVFTQAEPVNEEQPAFKSGTINVNVSTAPAAPKKKLGEKTWFIVLMLILFFPVGLYLVWKNPNWKKKTKIIITVIFVILAIASIGTSSNTSSSNSSSSDTEIAEEESVSAEYRNALIKAETYSDTMHMSKTAIYDQLTSEYGEGFAEDAAQYALDNLDADYNYNALMKAKTYRDDMAMSESAIYDQLVSEYGERFTAEEAQYAIDHLSEV